MWSHFSNKVHDFSITNKLPECSELIIKRSDLVYHQEMADRN